MQYGRFPMISQIEIITIIGMYNFLRLIEGKTNAVKITIAEAETDMRETICATFNAIAFAERLYNCIDSCIESILLLDFVFLLSKWNLSSLGLTSARFHTLLLLDRPRCECRGQRQ